MPPTKMRPPGTLAALLAVLMVAQSMLGLLIPSEYRDAEWMKASWFGNDVFTLTVAAPLLVIAILFARRGSVRGAMVWLGLTAYAVYNYAYYLFGAAMGSFFALYVVLLVLAVVTLTPNIDEAIRVP